MRPDTYIFIPDEKAFSELPQGLQIHFGHPTFVMSLEITKDTKLARGNADEVLKDIQEQGYHLQMSLEKDV